MKIHAYENQINGLLESDIETASLAEAEVKERLLILSDVVELFFLHLFTPDQEKIASSSLTIQLESNIKKRELTLRGKMIRLALSEPTLINQYNLLSAIRRNRFQELVKNLLIADRN